MQFHSFTDFELHVPDFVWRVEIKLLDFLNRREPKLVEIFCQIIKIIFRSGRKYAFNLVKNGKRSKHFDVHTDIYEHYRPQNFVRVALYMC